MKRPTRWGDRVRTDAVWHSPWISDVYNKTNNNFCSVNAKVTCGETRNGADARGERQTKCKVLCFYGERDAVRSDAFSSSLQHGTCSFPRHASRPPVVTSSGVAEIRRVRAHQGASAEGRSCRTSPMRLRQTSPPPQASGRSVQEHVWVTGKGAAESPNSGAKPSLVCPAQNS